MSLEEALVRERFIKEPHAFIRINDPRDYMVSLPDNNTLMGVLNLSFYDADSVKHMTKRYGYIKDGLFNENYAKQILNFVKQMEPVIDLLICHCRAGVSRSAGVSGALELIYNGSDKKVFDNKRFMPNMLVYSTILKVYHGKENSSCPAEKGVKND